MRLCVLVIALVLLSPGPLGGQPQETRGTTNAPTPETETVSPATTPPPAQSPQLSGEGAMEPAQVKELLRRLSLAEYRLNDLLTEVRPERWKLSDAARHSFQDLFDALRTQLTALESWRGQFDERPDSAYLGYMTYASIDVILPRLDAVTHMITQRENPSLGAQFSQAGNQLFDLQQALRPYLTFLLRNHDQYLNAAQTNLASCQSQLSVAKRGQTERAKPMKNILPDFKGRRRPRTAPAGGPASGPPSEPKK